MTNAVNLSAFATNTGLSLPTWTTGTRPASPINGQMGFNTTLNAIEAYSTSTSTWVNSVYPGAGIANSTGSAWGTSYTTSGTGTVVALTASPTFTGTVVAPTINAGAATALTLQSASTTALTIDTSQNVGIGTTSPSYKLDVSGSGIQTIRAITTDTSGANIARFIAQYTGGSGGTASAVDLRAGDGYTYLTSTTNTPLLFGTNTTERMRIHSSGGVSIGNTTDPGATNLSVTGTASVAGGTVSLTNGTSNLVLFNTNGVNPPAYTTRSTGTKIVLYSNLSSSTADFAIGIANSTLWNSVSDAGQQFQWYAGTGAVGTLTGTGAFTTTGKISDNKGDVRAAPIQSKTAAYVLVAADAGQTISITTGGVTVNASIFSAGDMVSIFNNSGSSQTITQGTSVTLRLSGTATTGNRTLAQYGVATLLCVIGGATPTFACTGAGLT